jgi:hypothetical protein
MVGFQSLALVIHGSGGFRRLANAYAKTPAGKPAIPITPDLLPHDQYLPFISWGG